MAKRSITIYTETTVEVDELEITAEGLQCPACKALNDISEVDGCVRANHTEVETVDGTFGSAVNIDVWVSPVDSNFETLHWLCNACSVPLAMPDDDRVEITW